MVKKYGKNYVEKSKSIEKGKKYDLQESLQLVKDSVYTKFVPTVEIHIKTGSNPKYNDQIIRGTVVLPHGTGKNVRVGAYVSDDKIEDAKNAGADVVGNTDLLQQIKNDEINFDVLVTTPDMMKELSQVAKILGPKGVMPSPRAGTVTDNIGQAIDEVKKGKVEFKLDKSGNIHLPIGKANFSVDQLKENFETLMKEIEDNRPSGVKGKLIRKVVLAPTMGPGVEVDY